jgi:ribose transport system permease protein
VINSDRLKAPDEPSRVAARAKRLDAARRVAASVAPVALLLGLLLAIGAVQPSFLSPYSLGVLAGESSVILLLAIGQTVVMIMGRIDLSMAALASLTSVLIAAFLPSLGVTALVAALWSATLLGALQGLVHARAQVPSFVVTLAGLGLWSGIALAIAPTTVPVEDGYEFVGWLEGRSFGVPHAFLFAIAALCLLQVVLIRMPFGRYLYAVGLGESAVLLSGIRVWRVQVLAFAVSGLFSGLAGTAMVARTSSGNPTIADSLLLPSIAAVLVGGTAITGGHGGLGRTLVGALLVTMMRVGIAAVGIDSAYEPIAFGGLVAIAAALTVDRARLSIVK